MRANYDLNGWSFEISDFELKLIKDFRKDVLRFIDKHIELEREYLYDRLDPFLFYDFKIMELKKIKRQIFQDSAFCEITYRQKIFDLDANQVPKITDNKNEFLHFIHRTNFIDDKDEAINVALKTTEMIFIDRLITLYMQPTPIKTPLIDEIYNRKGQKCFYYLSKNFPDSEKYTGIIKYSIIYRLLDKNKYTKKTTTQEKYFELIRKQFKDELNGKGFTRIESLNTVKNKRIKDKAEKLLNDFDMQIRTSLIDEIYNERGQKCFYYLSQNFPSNEKITGIVKYSIIYKVMEKNKYIKKTTIQEKYFQLVNKQFKDELNGKGFTRIESLNTVKNKRIKEKAEKLLNDFDKD